ncbi:MAG: hypothetical protein IH623_09475 [Verrucomicrobia bacterium]|nr:hypothetical protein [Verrucomicrobiota bacterium]
MITPKGNYLAVPLLAQLVELRLKAAGIHVLRTGGSGEFNNSRLSYAVGGNLGRALESLRDSLAELAGFATIGWFCKDENFVRTFHPRAGQALDLSDLDLIMADSLRAAASAGLSLETGGSK